MFGTTFPLIRAFSDLCGFTEAHSKRALNEIGLEDDKQQVPLTVTNKFFYGLSFRAAASLFTILNFHSTSCPSFSEAAVDGPTETSCHKIEKKRQIDAHGEVLVDPAPKLRKMFWPWSLSRQLSHLRLVGVQ